MKSLRPLLRVTQLRTSTLLIPPTRSRYTQHQGVKGIRKRKSFYEAQIQAGMREQNEPTVVNTGGMWFLDDRWVTVNYMT